MENSFIRKDFYVDPSGNKTEADWKEWIKADDKKAAADKAAYTKSFEHTEAPEWMQPNTNTVGGDGVHRQAVGIGFTGSKEDNTIAVERAVDADQEKVISLARMEAARNKRGGSRKGKSARRRKNKKNRK